MQPPFYNNQILSPKAIQNYKMYIKQQLLDRFQPHWDIQELTNHRERVYKETRGFRYWLHPSLQEQNYVNAYFPVWVLIAIHCENRQTVPFTGSADGYTSVFLSQHLSLQLLHDVASKIIHIKNPQKFIDLLDEYDLDLFYHKKSGPTFDRSQKAACLSQMFNGKVITNSCDKYTKMVMWNWSCVVLSMISPETIIQILDIVVKNRFTSTKGVADYFTFGEYIKDIPTYIDRYENELDASYLETYPHLDSNLLNRVGRYTLTDKGLKSVPPEQRLHKGNRRFAEVFTKQYNLYRKAVANNPFWGISDLL